MELTERDIERFWAKVDRSGGPDACWPWMGALDPSGYGAFKLAGRKVNSNRVIFAISNGRWPAPGMDVAHAPIVCHNRACCQPAHVREATRLENVWDMAKDGTLRTESPKAAIAAAAEMRRGRQWCLRGHPLSGDNLRRCKDGHRRCRTCFNDAQRSRYARKKELTPA